MAPDASAAQEQELEELTCPVCMDIYHKPCFTPCAHAFCFWCMHRSMSHGWQPESKCPYCRQPFGRFPPVCEALHQYVSWRFPAEAAAKEAAVKEFERSTGNISYDVPALPQAAEGLPASLFACVTCGEVSAAAAVLGCGHLVCGRPACVGLACARCGGRNAAPPHRTPLLKQLIARLAPAAQQPAEAPLAAAPGPGEAADGGGAEAAAHEPETVHFGVGCDGLSCGQLPIRGRRYRCLDCPEAMGFDLCGPCYDASLAVPELAGKFGQHHTRAHRMELVQPQQLTIGQIAQLVGQREMAPGEAVAGLQRLVDALEAEQHVARLRALQRAEARAVAQLQEHLAAGGGSRQPSATQAALAADPRALADWAEYMELEEHETVTDEEFAAWPAPVPRAAAGAAGQPGGLASPLEFGLGDVEPPPPLEPPQQQEEEQQQQGPE